MDINQTLFKYVVYYPTVFIRGQNVPYYLKQFNKSQYWHREVIEEFQLKKLQNLLKYAIKYVPFYQKKNRQFSLRSIKKIEDIKYMAPLTKEMLKENPEDFLTSKRINFLAKKTTGGSTGEPLSIWKTPYSMAMELAANWRGYSWAGVDIGDRQARFWGVPFGQKAQLRAKLIDFISNRKRCSAFAFDHGKLEEYTRNLRRFKPTYFHGYVSMLSEYAEFLKRNNLTHHFNLKCVITTSEILTNHHRNLLENVFSTKVYNEYGSAEMGSIAHECEYGSLHITAENMIVEVIGGDNKVCQPGEIGEIVCTDLNNYAMPLIRYRTGDFAAISLKTCDCGRTLPVLEKLYGRAYDMVKNREGKLFHGEYFMYIFEEAKRKQLGVKKFQVIQIDLDYFKIKVVPCDKIRTNKTEAFITGKIKNDFDSNAKVQYEYVDDITRSPSGKMRVVVGMDQR